ncbi:MAG: hypothetical protein ACXV3E_05695, partial [Halobacteriota archaeon]
RIEHSSTAQRRLSGELGHHYLFVKIRTNTNRVRPPFEFRRVAFSSVNARPAVRVRAQRRYLRPNFAVIARWAILF